MSRSSQIAGRAENHSFGILVDNIKNGYNAGLLVRSASAFGASYVGWSGQRYKSKGDFTNCDTEGFRFKKPIFAGVDNLKSIIPYKSVCVAVELCEGATSLFDFKHPKVCSYLLGPEDGSLSKEYLDLCQHKIYIPTLHCLNVVHCATAIMTHRMSQTILFKDDVIFCPSCNHNHYTTISETEYGCNACGHKWNPCDCMPNK